jgi:sortase A
VIPRVGISAVIVEGVDGRTLDRAVGHVPGTAELHAAGNVGLAAHRDTYFRDLHEVQPGDEVRIETIDGDRTYRVVRTWITAPDDVGVLAPAEGDVLTLVTCFPFWWIGPAPERFVVRAVAT